MKASITACTLDSTIFSASRAHSKASLRLPGSTSLKPRPRDAIDIVALFTVELDKHLVLFIASFAPDSKSKRKQADDQMRDHFHDLPHHLVTVPPGRLPGISASSTRMAFHEHVSATNTLTPRAISPDPVSLNDVAPAERWSYDLLEA